MYETTPLKDLQSELGETAQTGLTESEAAARLQKYGRNALAKTKRKSIFMHLCLTLLEHHIRLPPEKIANQTLFFNAFRGVVVPQN